MAQDQKSEPRVDRWIRAARDKKGFAVLIFVSLCVGGLATLADGWSKITKAINPNEATTPNLSVQIGIQNNGIIDNSIKSTTNQSNNIYQNGNVTIIAPTTKTQVRGSPWPPARTAIFSSRNSSVDSSPTSGLGLNPQTEVRPFPNAVSVPKLARVSPSSEEKVPYQVPPCNGEFKQSNTCGFGIVGKKDGLTYLPILHAATVLVIDLNQDFVLREYKYEGLPEDTKYIYAVSICGDDNLLLLSNGARDKSRFVKFNPDTGNIEAKDLHDPKSAFPGAFSSLNCISNPTK